MARTARPLRVHPRHAAWRVPVVALALASLLSCCPPPAPEVRLEALTRQFMADNGIAGGVLAWGDGSAAPTLLALGHVDPRARVPMTVDRHFRLASLSKPLTAAAIAQLAADGRLTLDTPLADILPDVQAAPDTRHRAITIRHLLQHRGGWDRRRQGDALVAPALRRDQHHEHDNDQHNDPDNGRGNGPDDGRDDAGCGHRARALLAQPLAFAPGTRQAYSNAGYCWLGEVIRARSRMPWARYVQHAVLAPVGLHAMHVAGDGVPAARLATRWRRTGDGHWQALADDAAARRELQQLGPFGGWTATAEDYFRFTARAGTRTTGDHAGRARQTAAAANDNADGNADGNTDGNAEKNAENNANGNDAGYGIDGWRHWQGQDGITRTHTGILAGTFAFAVRSADGRVVVGLFNGGEPAHGARLHALVAAVRGLLAASPAALRGTARQAP